MRRSKKTILPIILGIILISSGLFLLLKQLVQQVFTVRTILVETADPTVFETTQFLNEKQNLLLLKTEVLAQEFKKKYPRIKDITVTKKYPSTLLVRVSERQPIGVFDNAGQRIYVDETATILLPQTEYQNNTYAQLICSIPLLSPGETVADIRVQKGLELLQKISHETTEQVVSVACGSDNSQIIFELADTKILAASYQDMSIVMSSLHFLFKQFRIEGNRPKTIDMRFEKPVLITEEVQVASSSTESSSSQ